MKSYIKTGILLLWILGGLNTFSQKKILTPDSYQEWKRIDNPDLSPVWQMGHLQPGFQRTVRVVSL